MNVREQFGANVRRARKRTGMSQEALAFRAGIHRTEVGLLERGERMARIDTLLKVAAATDHTPAELLEGIEWTIAEMQPGQFVPPAELPCDDA